MDNRCSILILAEQVAYLRQVIKAQIDDNFSVMDMDNEHVLTSCNIQLARALEVTADYQKYVMEQANG